jgi:hypothetical protein
MAAIYGMTMLYYPWLHLTPGSFTHGNHGESDDKSQSLYHSTSYRCYHNIETIGVTLNNDAGPSRCRQA